MLRTLFIAISLIVGLASAALVSQAWAGPLEDGVAAYKKRNYETAMKLLKPLEDVLIQDYRVSSATARSHDLVEGIRAQIIDKDRNPKWSPASLAAVTQADVDAYFAPVADDLSF